MADRMAGIDGPLVDGARSAEQAAGRMKDRVVEGAKEQLEVTRHYVTENPMKSVLVAVGVGALLGYLLGRRSHS
jgi:ElaB/YqjD/DUF883 family membrane-anchored ribosome-binding protein